MPKKIINLRRTNRFRYIQQPQSMRPGPSGIEWSSCHSTTNPSQGKGGGGGGGFQTAYGVTYLGWRYQQEGLKMIAQGFGAAVMPTGINLPKMVAGAGLFSYGSTLTAKFTRPCSEPDENGAKF
jgi:hypothetical protein